MKTSADPKEKSTPPKHGATAERRVGQASGPRRSPLDCIFAPRSVAVIGASERGGTVGRAIVENLRLFKGGKYLVNAKRKEILGTPAYPNLKSVPHPVDLAIIAIPAAQVSAAIGECAETGVRGAVIISAGFREAGATGAALEKDVIAESRKINLRFVGPNCLGVMIPQEGFNATFAAKIANPGSVAFLSQSGALCTAILDWSMRENVGFSAFVSMGSMADVSWGDLITFFGDDPRTKSIVCYMESVGNARAFLSAAREVALTKPIIVLKVGRTEAAAKAAASHTGTLTGSDAVLDAAFRRVGVLRVDTLGELFDMAEVLGKQPRPVGPKLSIVTNAGGPGALAADMLVSSGGKLAQLSPSTLANLNSFLPPFWSGGNPIDILGDADAARYAKAVELAIADPQTDGILTIVTPQAMTDATGTATQIARVAPGSHKPILASWMGGPSMDAGNAILNVANIATFDAPDTAARAFAGMWQYSEGLRAIYETPSLGSPANHAEINRAKAAKLIASVIRSDRTVLTEAESKEILSCSGIPTVETRVATHVDEAVKHAEAMGFPVVLKLYSQTITHKSDVGGVQLNLRTTDAVRQAWQLIEQTVVARAGKEHFLGVTVQQMVRNDGFEIILGSSIDPQFGPVLMFGTGGKFVEIFRDTVLGIPPLNATLAQRLMERTKIYNALKGVRGERAVNIGELSHLLVRFSQLVAEQPRIAEIDINPLLVSAERIVALDARIILHPSTIVDEQLPRLAIQPYPSHYISSSKLRNGKLVTMRPIRPEDEPAMVAFHQTLSDRSVYYRYFAPLKLEQRIAHERLSRICFIDYDREMALVAEHQDGKGAAAEIAGVGRLSRSHGVNEAEFALVVSDKWQGQGLGSRLLAQLIQIGKDEKLDAITASVLPDNREMLQVARRAGFQMSRVENSSEIFARLELEAESVSKREGAGRSL